MKYREMTKNYIFRELQCGLSVKEAANLCFKSVRTIKQWDAGKEIPPECKRLMRLHRRMDLSTSDEWDGFKMCGDKLVLPTGRYVTARQVLAGIALLEIGAPNDVRVSTELIKTARALNKLKEI